MFFITFSSVIYYLKFFSYYISKFFVRVDKLFFILKCLTKIAIMIKHKRTNSLLKKIKTKMKIKEILVVHIF